jgi:citrate synthase
VGREAAQELTISTAVTSMADGVLRYRGREVSALAAAEPFEAVATLLWTGALAWEPCVPASRAVAAAEAVRAVTPPGARLIDRLRLIADVAAIADPLRFDLTPASVVTCGRALLGVLVDGLAPTRRRPVALTLPDQPSRATALATRLWPRLSSRPARAGGVRALNGALVLSADHELATSTFAARVAASTRANPYAVVAAGLGALDGPLHGTASELVHRVLVDAEADGVDAAVSRRLRHGDRLPGFGHPLYPDGDPRAGPLLRLLHDAGDAFDGKRLALGAEVLAAIAGRTGLAANSDFALGVMAFAGGMAPDAGEVVFAIARCAGWLAHALEEYAEAPLRFRIRARAL